MNSFTAIALFAVLACASAGFIAAPSAKILQGPSSRTTVVGPDGSAISAVAPGGRIVTEEHPGIVAHAAPVVAAAPVLAHAAYAAPVVAHHGIAHAAYAAPVVAHHGIAHAAYAAPIAYAGHGIVARHGLYF